MANVNLKEVIEHLGQVRVPERPTSEVLIGRVEDVGILREVHKTEEMGRAVEAAAREAHQAMIKLVAARESFEVQQQGMWSEIQKEIPVVQQQGHYSVNPITGDVFELTFKGCTGCQEEEHCVPKHLN